ncbi:peptidase M16 [Gammaproteobacteria bacterium 42_54_T18]|nr:peptidase M16 [Gammaproteobacteria bacterium 42_54_T18]
MPKTSAASSNSTENNHPAHESFEWLRTEAIESLHVSVSEYRHKKTGAMHYHIDADNDENVFLVGLRTIPTDSTGVAHILEHTALCGSEKYPVRDPFFMMIRRSLNTFMNAFTSSDWTAYPFASKNKKDFDNLLNVYLDAVFFSRIDPLDFAQEGHRIEFEDAENTDSNLVYKGVVYNEMKGALSSPVSVLYETAKKYLFPTSTYHFNSGGEPSDIPNLSYEQLMAFYRTHYHPSNAIFMTYGNIPAQEHQQNFEEKALHRFEQLETRIEVQPETRYFSPIKIEEAYPIALAPNETTEHKSHILLGWLLGKSTDLESQLKAHLLSDVLLENSASPLQKLLETCGLGNAPSPLCGLEDSNLEMAFMCGIEGSNPEIAVEFEKQVMSLLEKLAKDCVEEEKLDAILHQLELSQREVGGDQFPYGLQMILDALSPAIHRGDPIKQLNLDPVLEQLRIDIKDPNFIKQLIQEQLLDNPHRICLTLRPDTEIDARKEARVQLELQRHKQQLSNTEKDAIVEKTKQLLERQSQEDDIDILPKVCLDDVPAHTLMAKQSQDSINNQPIALYPQGTNGLTYLQVFFSLPDLSPEQQQLLPLYTHLVGELGAGEDDYLAIQDEISACSGGIGCFTTIRSDMNDEQSISAHLGFSGKALNRNAQPMFQLLNKIITRIRFDELERIRELVAQYRSRLDQSITGHGHGLAMQAASSGLSPIAHLSHNISGLAGIQAVQKLDQSLKNTESLSELADNLTVLHSLVTLGQKQFLLIGEEPNFEQQQQILRDLWLPDNIPTEVFSLPKQRQQVKQCWLTNTQVNFCAKAYPTVPSDHVDAAPLVILGGVLRNGYLHRAIREQGGAYGGGASQESNIAAFRFYSYRDPRLSETLTDFDLAVQWFLDNQHKDEVLEEAILGVIGALDKPSSPAGEAKHAFQNRLFNRGDEFQGRFRQRVLATTLDDLTRVAKTYLTNENASSIAVITSQQHWEDEKLSGFTIENV